MSDAERKAAITEMRKKFLELHEDAYENNRNLAQERGRQFEKLPA